MLTLPVFIPIVVTWVTGRGSPDLAGPRRSPSPLTLYCAPVFPARDHDPRPDCCNELPPGAASRLVAAGFAWRAPPGAPTLISWRHRRLCSVLPKSCSHAIEAAESPERAAMNILARSRCSSSC